MGKTKKTQGKSQNKGLPGGIIKQYGAPVTWKMITEEVWNEYYKSEEGKARLAKLIQRGNEKVLTYNAYIANNDKPVAQRSIAEVEDVAKRNAAAKIKARTKKRVVVR